MNMRYLFLSVIAALLSACASTTQPLMQNNAMMLAQPKGATLNKANSPTSLPNSWNISGAMAARNKSKSWTASVNWAQQGAGNYQIRLFGPLGSGTVLVERHGSTTTLRDGPKTFSDTNADELLSKHTGVRLPVGSLYYWVRGIPAPGAVQMSKKDSANRLLVLQQAGYRIEYLGYSNFSGISLPTQIRLQGNGVFIKFVIKRWNI